MEHTRQEQLTAEARHLLDRCVSDERVSWETLSRLYARWQRRRYGQAALPLANRRRAASWVLVPCPGCDGAGLVEQAIPGGTFDTALEQWYPAERTVLCDRCNGEGVILREAA